MEHLKNIGCGDILKPDLQQSQTLTQSLDAVKAAAALCTTKQAAHLCEVVNTHWLQLTHGPLPFCSFLYNHTSEEEGKKLYRLMLPTPAPANPCTFKPVSRSCSDPC